MIIESDPDCMPNMNLGLSKLNWIHSSFKLVCVEE